MYCNAFREWGDYRCGSFGLFESGESSGPGRWKMLAPDGVLSAVIASRHEAVRTPYHPTVGTDRLSTFTELQEED